jgi:hypothetical protein
MLRSLTPPARPQEAWRASARAATRGVVAIFLVLASNVLLVRVSG